MDNYILFFFFFQKESNCRKCAMQDIYKEMSFLCAQISYRFIKDILKFHSVQKRVTQVTLQHQRFKTER